MSGSIIYVNTCNVLGQPVRCIAPIFLSLRKGTFNKPRVPRFVTVEMKFRPNPPVPRPAVSAKQPHSRAREGWYWRRTSQPSEDRSLYPLIPVSCPDKDSPLSLYLGAEVGLS